MISLPGCGVRRHPDGVLDDVDGGFNEAASSAFGGNPGNKRYQNRLR